MGDDVTLVSSDVETANDVYRVLVSRGMERRSTRPPTYRYEATGESTSAFLDLAHRLIGPEIPSVELVQTGAIHLPGRAEHHSHRTPAPPHRPTGVS